MEAGPPSLCLTVSLFSPLAFPLIFNKQQLRLSATGRQFVPTRATQKKKEEERKKKKSWQQALEETIWFQKSKPVCACLVQLCSLSRCADFLGGGRERGA